MTKDEMLANYEVLGFAFGYLCIVKRKSDGVKGTLHFADYADGRIYTNFQEA
jgi:hypothetical protein